MTRIDATNAVSIRIEGVTVEYDSVRAVDNVTIEARPGEILALLGPSGCGKSTILKVIAGLVKPKAGSIYIGSRPVDAVLPNRRNVGMVFQNYALFPHLSVRQNIDFGLKLKGIRSEKRVEQIDYMLRLLQIEALAERYPREISGGQQQRVALARAFAVQPAVMLLDEPLSALDRQMRDTMRIELPDLLRRVGITTILVTHDQDEALGIAERIVVMRNGRIEQAGTPQEIYDRPTSRFVSQFIGHMNYLPATVIWADRQSGTTRVNCLGIAIDVDFAGPVAAGDSATLGIRPEELTLRLSDTAGGSAKDTLVGKIVREQYLGGMIIYEVALPSDLRITVHCARAMMPHGAIRGSEVLIALATERSRLFTD